MSNKLSFFKPEDLLVMLNSEGYGCSSLHDVPAVVLVQIGHTVFGLCAMHRGELLKKLEELDG